MKEEFPLFEEGRPYTYQNRVPHMGRMVKKVLRQQRLTAKALAGLLGCTPAAVSKLLNSPYLHSKLLMRLSTALNYDFFAYLCQCPKNPPPDTSGLEARIAELEKENTALKKEVDVLQKLVQALEKG